MKFLISVLFSFISIFSYASEYTVIKLGTESFDHIKWEHITAINSKGQVLGTYRTENQRNHGLYLADKNNGVLLLEMDENQMEGCPWPIALNNLGQVLSNGYNSQGDYGVWLWSRLFGFYWLNIYNSKHSTATAFNDLAQVIGSYRPNGNTSSRAFLWDNGVVTDMGPDSKLAKQIEDLGYYVRDICLTSINNKGEIVGFFTCGKYNAIKKKYINTGFVSFFWNGDVHPIYLEGMDPLMHFPNILQINNQSIVMISSGRSTYLWDKENGVKTIDFDGQMINDNNVILGRSNARIPLGPDDWENPQAIWKNGIVKNLTGLLGVKDLRNMSPRFSDTYSVEKLDRATAINNSEEIVCEGVIWNESHPVLISPTDNKKK